MSDIEKATIKVGAEAYEWWRGLQPAPVGSGRGDKAALSKLSRAPDPLSALMVSATIDLWKRLGSKDYDADRVAVMAAVLARVKKNDSERVARRLGEGRRVKEVRFSRLISTDDPTDLMRQLGRVIRMIDDCANVRDLAESIYDLTDPLRAGSRRRRWLYDYHGASMDDA